MAEEDFSSGRFLGASMEVSTVVQAEMTTFSAEAHILEVRLAEDFPAAEVPSGAEALQEAFKEDVYEGI